MAHCTALFHIVCNSSTKENALKSIPTLKKWPECMILALGNTEREQKMVFVNEDILLDVWSMMGYYNRARQYYIVTRFVEESLAPTVVLRQRFILRRTCKRFTAFRLFLAEVFDHFLINSHHNFHISLICV